MRPARLAEWELDPRDIAGLALLLLAGLGLSLANGGVVGFGLVIAAAGVAVVASRAAVAAIAMAVPFIHRPVQIRGGDWSLLELAIALAALGVGIQLLLELARNRNVGHLFKLLKPWSISVAAGLVIAVAAFSLTTVANPRYRPDSIREFRWVIVEPIIALLLFRWLVRERGGTRLLLGAFLGMASVVAAIGVVQIVTQTGVVVADGVERATGPYRHPNNLALYLDRAAVLALALAVGARQQRRLLAISAIVTGLGLAATLSRGAVLAYLAGACWIVAVSGRRRGWRWIAAGVAVGAILIGALGTSRLTDSGSGANRSSRELIWSAAIDMIRDHPIAGIGLDQFVNQYGRRYIDPAGWQERYTSHPHNLVLDVWLRLGIAGLVVFALLAIAVVLLARRGFAGDRNALWLGATGALLAGVVHGMVDNGFFLPDLAVMTWMLIALMESSVRGGEADG